MYSSVRPRGVGGCSIFGNMCANNKKKKKFLFMYESRKERTDVSYFRIYKTINNIPEKFLIFP